MHNRIPWALLHGPLLPPPGAPTLSWSTAPASLSPAWPSEGLRKRRESPPRHAVVLRSFRIPVPKPLLPHLGWKRGFRSHRGRRTCASTRRCRSCGARVVAPRSSRPWGRLRHLRQQRLCGSVIPPFRSSRVRVWNSYRYSITNK
jgi:hypothetical protein